ncbi:MAG TPA: hypothetical protein VEQ58_01200 [Polyangiaceae bacterium]|nr:hypothetical protein [Polyangiaceae bacterium]
MGGIALLLGCAGNGESGAPTHVRPTFLDEPLADLPERLSDVGIYPELPALRLAPQALAYEPGYPLWSDGGAKQRALVLPVGASIDASDPASYAFPSGTLLFKTFSFRTAASPDRVVPVETRLLRLGAEGWELAAYGWDDDAADATLLDLKRAQTREVLGDDGEPVSHSIPSRLQCRQCHESSPNQVLGLSELQLAKSGSLAALASRLAPAPHAPYDALPEQGPLTTAVLGYFVGNCTHCHNGTNGAASSFDLRPRVALDNVIDQPTASSASADGIRIEPGRPEESVLYLAMRGDDDSDAKNMPPLGVARRDASALELLDHWIRALGDEPDP